MPAKTTLDEHDAHVRRVTLEIAARAGIDVRTSRRAVLQGPAVLHAMASRARVSAAAREIGVELPIVA